MKKKKRSSLNELPIKRKSLLLSGDGAWSTHELPEISLKKVTMNDGPMGLRVPSSKVDNIASEDILPATCFPAPSLLACSWNPSLMEKVGKAFAYEAVLKGTNIVLAPGINIKRNPLCGRNFEYYSEDPLLSGELAASFINGVQAGGVGVSLKHFAANNCEYHRLSISSEVDMRALREIYLKGFEIAIKKSNPWTVMCSYNRINGVYASQNEWLLDKLLRQEWGYGGVVMSDWGAVLDPVLAHARGLDLEMPNFDKKRHLLISKAVKDGRIDKRRFEAEVNRVASLSNRVEEAASLRDELVGHGNIDSHDVALEAALDSVVLAKNDGVLPLKKLKDICVIGAYAKEPHYRGLGSAKVKSEHVSNFYDVASERLGEALPFAKGYDPLEQENEESLRIDAIDLAASSKLVLLFLGSSHGDDTECYDRHDMHLSESQVRLFEAIYAQNKNVVLILSSGSPMELPFASKCRAILLDYLSGEAGGEALLKLILGEHNPSGHLAESWPIRYIDCPSSLFYPGDNDVSLYKESIFVGYRYYLSAKKDVLFPFGYGLSYSEFSLLDGKISRESLRDGQRVKVSIKVRNDSKLSGATVVQCYIGAHSKKTIHPLRELKAFQKIYLGPKKSKTVTFELDFSSFSHFGATSESWVVNNDEYSIDIGLNCRDIAFSKTIKVNSSHHSRDMRFLLPSYFLLPQNGAWRISDAEFEILLGHSLSKNIRKKRKKYRHNSSFHDIEGTMIGKILKKKIVEKMSQDNDGQSLERSVEMVMSMPIRILLTMGYSKKHIDAIVALANHRPFKALWCMIIG